MRLIVDTFNVLHVWTGGPSAGGGRDVAALAAAIARSEFGSWQATLVCDGAPPAHLGEGMRFRSHGREVLYAGGGCDADSLIEGLCEASDAPRRMVVVSSDRRVQRAGRRRGGRAMDSLEFVRRLAHTREDRGEDHVEVPVEPETDAELERWLRYFGVENGPETGAGPPRSRTDPHPGRRTPSGGESVEPAPPDSTGDPLLDAARREWPGRIRAEELDMERWLEEDGEAGGARARGAGG